MYFCRILMIQLKANGLQITIMQLLLRTINKLRFDYKIHSQTIRSALIKEKFIKGNLSPRETLQWIPIIIA